MPKRGPQRSIRGPVLFSLFLSNLHTVIHYSFIHFYADESHMLLSHQLDQANVANVNFYI